MTLRQRIARFCKQLGGQSTLASTAGVSPNTVKKAANGGRIHHLKAAKIEAALEKLEAAK